MDSEGLLGVLVDQPCVGADCGEIEDVKFMSVIKFGFIEEKEFIFA